MATILPQIKHIVVVMLENRSFDNLCGWTYTGQSTQPSLFLPAGSSSAYNGLNSSLSNPSNPLILREPNHQPAEPDSGEAGDHRHHCSQPRPRRDL